MTKISYGTIETAPQPRDDMSELQYYILANVQSVSAFLSFCGSLYFIREIIGNKQTRAAKLQNVSHRIMLVLSIKGAFHIRLYIISSIICIELGLLRNRLFRDGVMTHMYVLYY